MTACSGKKRPVLRRVVLLLLLIIAGAGWIERNLTRVTLALAQAEARTLARQVLSAAADAVIREGVPYNELMIVSTDETGSVRLLQADTAAMNSLSARAVDTAQQYLGNTETHTVQVPLGSVFGLTLLAGAGPEVNVAVLPVGSVSAQFDTEFAADDYDEIKKVYSIWLCMNTPLYMGNGISVYQMSKNDLIAGIKDRPQAYDKLAVVLIAVNDQIEDSTGSEAYDRMSRLLKVVLSAELSLEEKKDILESEYELEMESKTEGELGKMCNLAEGIEERGIQKGIQKGIQVLIEAYKEMNLDRKTAAEQVGQKYNLTEEKIAEVMERYWGE